MRQCGHQRPRDAMPAADLAPWSHRRLLPPEKRVTAKRVVARVVELATRHEMEGRMR